MLVLTLKIFYRKLETHHFRTTLSTFVSTPQARHGRWRMWEVFTPQPLPPPNGPCNIEMAKFISLSLYSNITHLPTFLIIHQTHLNMICAFQVPKVIAFPYIVPVPSHVYPHILSALHYQRTPLPALRLLPVKYIKSLSFQKTKQKKPTLYYLPSPYPLSALNHAHRNFIYSFISRLRRGLAQKDFLGRCYPRRS